MLSLLYYYIISNIFAIAVTLNIVVLYYVICIAIGTNELNLHLYSAWWFLALLFDVVLIWE